MGHAKIKTFVGIIFFVTGISLLVFIKSFKSTLLILFIITSLIGYILNRTFNAKTKHLEVDIEKMEEEFNLLSNEKKAKENDNSRMRSSLERISRLKSVLEDYSQTVSEEDILDCIVRDSFALFEDAGRVLLYLVDTEKQ